MRDCFFKQVFTEDSSDANFQTENEIKNKKCQFHQDSGMELRLLLPEISPGKTGFFFTGFIINSLNMK